MSKMTLEQVRSEMQVLYGAEVNTAHLDRWSDAIDAHLARQSEGVSEEVTPEILAVAVCARNKEYTRAQQAGEPRNEGRETLAALTAVWHNRPAQEPSEGHSVRVLSRDGDWEGEARWEYQESAYVTQEAVRPAKERATNYVSGHADSTGKFNATAQEKAEPVAVIGPVWQILWCDSESIAAIAKKHGLKIGDKLYTAPPPAAGVPDGWKLAIAHIQKKADDYAEENCGVEWDTGATTYKYGQAGEDYHHSLLELVDELTDLSATPSPTIDVAAVREVICWLRAARGVPLPTWDQLGGMADKLARAIGDAK